MIIPGFVLNMINQIENAGYEAYVVGGCVRDNLLGKPPNDWDITTSALPGELMQIFNHVPIIPTGIKHGTVTVLTEKTPVEITTYRIDGEYADNRHPAAVVFSQSITDDLSRRDFTVNAMAFNPASGLVDPFDGISDLKQKLIKCVGNPKKRFQEDALRIMRALRFSAVLDFKTEVATKRAIFTCTPLLKNIAAERISAELARIITCKDPTPVLDEFMTVFACILGFDITKKVAVWKRNISLIPHCPANLPVRLTILFDELYDDFIAMTSALKNLKLDKKTQNTVKFLSNELHAQLPDKEIMLKKLLVRVSPDILILTAQAQLARFPEKSLQLQKILQAIEKILSENQCVSLKQLAVNGNDLQKHLGIHGKNTGTTLNFLLNAVIEEKCQNSFDELINYAKNKCAY